MTTEEKLEELKIFNWTLVMTLAIMAVFLAFCIIVINSGNHPKTLEDDFIQQGELNARIDKLEQRLLKQEARKWYR